MIGTQSKRLERMEQRFGAWSSTNGVAMLRVSLGLVFVWFGVLRFCPGLGDGEVLAGKAVRLLTLGMLPVRAGVWLLGVVECGIGAGLVAGVWMRATIVTLLLHLIGTSLAMMVFAGETWRHFPYVPALVGQEMLVDLVLLAAAVVVAGKAFAGKGTVLHLVPARAGRGTTRLYQSTMSGRPRASR